MPATAARGRPSYASMVLGRSYRPAPLSVRSLLNVFSRRAHPIRQVRARAQLGQPPCSAAHHDARRAGDVSSSTCTHAHDLYPSVILPVFARTTVGKILRNIICMTPTPGYSLGMTVEHSRMTVSTNNKLRKVYVECVVWRNNYSTLITFMTSSLKSKSLRSNPIHTLSHFTQQTVHTVLDTVRLETHSLIARPIDSASRSSETDVHSSEVQV